MTHLLVGVALERSVVTIEVPAMKKWFPPSGALLTALGILIGFNLPTIASRWSGPAELSQEHLVQGRAIIGTIFVLLGVALIQ